MYHYGTYFDNLFAPADFVLKFLSMAMEVVLRRAILRIFCSALMCLLAFIILGVKNDRPANVPLRNGSLLDVMTLIRDSPIPDVVSAQSVEKTDNPGTELVGLLMEKKLRYGPSNDLDGYNLDIPDRLHHTSAELAFDLL